MDGGTHCSDPLPIPQDTLALLTAAWFWGIGGRAPQEGICHSLVFNYHASFLDSACQGNDASGKAALSSGVQEMAALCKQWSPCAPHCHETHPHINISCLHSCLLTFEPLSQI